VTDFFAGKIDRAAALREADYVFVGPRESKLGKIDPAGLPLREVFAAGDVTSGFAEQVLIAIGEGAKAALSAYEYLLPRL
jgi:NADPH-dependent glutamate synthase beta subunit-like oxidoreductase